jgi:hypothetical protein
MELTRISSSCRPLSAEAPFSHVAAILRVSSPDQLDLPGVHCSARAYIMAMFPQGPRPFAHPSSSLEEALTLVHSYQIPLVGSRSFQRCAIFTVGSSSYFFLLFSYWCGVIKMRTARLLCLHLTVFLDVLLWHDDSFHWPVNRCFCLRYARCVTEARCAVAPPSSSAKTFHCDELIFYMLYFSQ